MTAAEYNEGVTRWADDAMRFAACCCADRADCEDAVQEAFAALWKSRSRVGADKGKAYLLGTVYRRLVDRLRHRYVERAHAGELHGDEAVRPDETFDLRDALAAALASLPETQRAILQLRDVEGYAYAEIAEILKLSVDQVQVYLFRARVQMRKQLIKMGYDHNRQ